MSAGGSALSTLCQCSVSAFGHNLVQVTLDLVPDAAISDIALYRRKLSYMAFIRIARAVSDSLHIQMISRPQLDQMYQESPVAAVRE
jgi:hypothetical protein